MASETPKGGYIIGGVRVQFPFKPYPSQFAMMNKIIKGLDSKENCLLESPTGSGKSLVLLCSSLAWLQLQQEKREKLIIQCEASDVPEPIAESGSHCCNKESPEIVDLTKDKVTIEKKRNLSQSDDFQPEKKLRYSDASIRRPIDFASCDSPVSNSGSIGVPKCTAEESPKTNPESKVHKQTKIPKIFFGTRTHKQITQIVRELKRTHYSDFRMTILSSRERTCIHPSVSTSRNKNEACAELLDEQLCTYYSNAKRVTMDSIRSIRGFREAWDIEEFVKLGKRKSMCPYYKLRDLMEDAEIIFCPYNYLIDPSIRSSMEINLRGNIVILDEAHNIEDSARSAASFEVTVDQLKKGMDDFEGLERIGAKSSVHGYFTSKMSSLSQLINQYSSHLDEYNSFEQQGKTWVGHELVALLSNIGLGPGDFSTYQHNLSKLNEEKELSKSREEIRSPTVASSTLVLLKGLQLSFHFLYKNNMEFVDDFRVAILRTMSKVPEKSSSGWIKKKTVMGWTLSLNLWCLNPAVAFSEIKDEVHSLILTSGTLSPMVSFQSELGMPFRIQLEANHVIKDSQVWVGTVSHGPRGSLLNGTFKHSETFIFQDDVGQLILEVCQTIPHGVLCFFPSYGMMEKLTNRWQSTGLWEELEAEKRVLSEPKSSHQEDFNKIMTDFYETIEETTESNTNDMGQSGALFLAVCRGKVSEGLDFADNNARAVITVGIPFPSIKDVQVDLKKSYNNQHHKARSLLSGNEWYECQAFRALNQALGRCIRHKSDWGAIILVDERLTRVNRYVQSFSKWVRKRITKFNNFESVKKSLKEFSDFRSKQVDAGDESVLSLNDSMSSSMCSSIVRTPIASQVNGTPKMALNALVQLLPSSNTSESPIERIKSDIKEEEPRTVSPNLFDDF